MHLLEVPSTLDRSKGDIHAAGNPHYMIDPVNAAIAADEIAEGLGKLDAKNAAKYQANAKQFRAVKKETERMAKETRTV